MEDWHWLVFGMLLILAELFVPSFTIFWFGLAAIAVAGMVWLDPELSLTWQLFVWSIASCVFTLLWFKLVRPLMRDRTKAGTAKEAVIGETGHVTRAPRGSERGTVRFVTPLLGAEEWPFICGEPVQPGDRVEVQDVSGNTLVVAKARPRSTEPS